MELPWSATRVRPMTEKDGAPTAHADRPSKETAVVNLRLAALVAALALPSTLAAIPASAEPDPNGDTTASVVPISQLAPADEYFGRYQMSVLGIANTIRDAGSRIDEGRIPSMIDGPLSFVSDAIHAWQHDYPNDPWIAKDLLALELVYLKAGTPQAFALARKTEAWLVRDYPDVPAAEDARVALADAGGAPRGAAAPSTGTDAWTRFAALRAPLPSVPTQH